MDRLVAAPRRALVQAKVPEEAVDALRNPDEGRLQQDLDWLAAPGHHLLTAASEEFPPLLAGIPGS